jgi:endonuclease G
VQEATLISAAIDMAAAAPGGPVRAGAARAAGGAPAGAEAIRGATLDFVGVAFLERGRRAADAVGRVAFLSGAPQGTGFLVAPGLFLTNHHVIESPAQARRFQVQFDYEYDLLDRERSTTAFFFDPEVCFVTDTIDGLDYTLIGVGQRRSGERALDRFGYVTLSDASDKHMLGEIANVIQHPDGRFKELVLRENHLVARDETHEVLHYVADTEQGSSGSPVFNNEWEPIALHHWGGPWREVMSTTGRPLSREINEGIRISAIVRDLRQRSLGGSSAAAVRRAIGLWDETARRGPGMAPSREAVVVDDRRVASPGAHAASSSRMNHDGSVTWTFPIEISVRAPLVAPPVAAPAAPTPREEPLPMMAARPPGPPDLPEAAGWQTETFDDRGGYEPGFIPGFLVPLPDFGTIAAEMAKNRLAAPGDDPFELRYHHFSIVMNAKRRLACFTAVNIDGVRIKAVVRDDKTVIDEPTLRDLGIESLEGAEASDDFRPDRRILPEEQMNRPFYERQKIAGFPDPKSPERIARMFQKGHIVLRGDPAWGIDAEAVAAERDTFFYTNAAPQVGFFNQGSRLDRPGSKGKLRWRAVESYVLRNAVTMRSRVSVFAGPVFDDVSDPIYRFGSRVPMRFWKIALWNDGEGLRSIALLADQRPVLQVMPEAIGFGEFVPEAFGDEEELARVSEFLSTVEEIEALTGLAFPAIRDADIRAGEAAATPVADLEAASLSAARKPKRRRANSPRRAKPKR